MTYNLILPFKHMLKRERSMQVRDWPKDYVNVDFNDNKLHVMNKIENILFQSH